MAGTWVGTSTLCLHTEECSDELEDDDNVEQHSVVSLIIYIIISTLDPPPTKCAAAAPLLCKAPPGKTLGIGGSRPQLDEISNTFYAKSYYIY
jgi:hypothetical protein